MKWQLSDGKAETITILSEFHVLHKEFCNCSRRGDGELAVPPGWSAAQPRARYGCRVRLRSRSQRIWIKCRRLVQTAFCPVKLARHTYAVLRQVPDRMPDKSAAFANSPSLASRLTLQPYRARSCAALHPGGMRDGASTKSAAKARQVLLRIQGRYGIIGTFQQGTREHFYYK